MYNKSSYMQVEYQFMRAFQFEMNMPDKSENDTISP